MKLETAILIETLRKAAGREAFSAYDITKSLREKANNGLVKIKGLEPTRIVDPANPYATKEVPNIPHDSVRDVVHQIFEEENIADYEKVNPTGRYFLYRPILAHTEPQPGIPAAEQTEEEEHQQ